QLPCEHVPPRAPHARASQLGSTHWPSTQLPPLSTQADAAHVRTQVSPSQLPPAARQVSGSQLTLAPGGSYDGASSLFPAGPTSGGGAQATTNVGMSKARPLSKCGVMRVSRLRTPVSSSKPAKPAVHASLTATAR